MTRNTRIIIIIQLCLGFSFLMWLLIQPSVKQTMIKKTSAALMEELVQRKSLFDAIPSFEKEQFIQNYQHFQNHSTSYFSNLKYLLFKETSFFSLIWLLFSILIPFLLLFQVEGASYTALLLPFAVLCEIAFFVFFPPQIKESIFPSEKYVLEKYSESVATQNARQRLENAWHGYIVTEWAFETPSLEEKEYQNQVEKGLFAFNRKRMQRLMEGKGDGDLLMSVSGPTSLSKLILYLAWNIFFVWRIRREKSYASQTA